MFTTYFDRVIKKKVYVICITQLYETGLLCMVNVTSRVTAAVFQANLSACFQLIPSSTHQIKRACGVCRCYVLCYIDGGGKV